jgi:Flp pilus assembly protein TadG
MMRPSAGRARSHGQSLVEFALFVSILLLLLGGVTDLAMLLNDHLAVAYAARQGVLAAAMAGTDALADCDALAAVASATQGLPGMTVTRIVLYESASDGQPVGGAGSTAKADVYVGNPGCANPVTPPSPSPGNWLPAARDATLFTASSIGIEIDYQYAWQTTLVATGTLSVTDDAVMPISSG